MLDHARRLVAIGIGIGIGIDPSWVDEQDMPAIHITGWEGQADVVEWLLDFGSDLARKNMSGGDLKGHRRPQREFCPNRRRRDHLRLRPGWCSTRT